MSISITETRAGTLTQIGSIYCTQVHSQNTPMDATIAQCTKIAYTHTHKCLPPTHPHPHTVPLVCTHPHTHTQYH